METIWAHASRTASGQKAEGHTGYENWASSSDDVERRELGAAHIETILRRTRYRGEKRVDALMNMYRLVRNFGYTLASLHLYTCSS